MSRTSYGKRNDGVYASLTEQGEIYLFVTWAKGWPRDCAKYGDRILSVDEAKALADALNEMVAKAKPSVVDQFNAFPIGQVFVTDHDPEGEVGFWVKISKSEAIYCPDYTAEPFPASHYTKLYPFTPKED